jgi:hypothetical protein
MLDGWKGNFWEKNMGSMNKPFTEFEYLVIPKPSHAWKSEKFRSDILMNSTSVNFLPKITFPTMQYLCNLVEI